MLQNILCVEPLAYVFSGSFGLFAAPVDERTGNNLYVH